MKRVDQTFARYEQFVLSEEEFRAALRRVTEEERYPFLVLGADDLEEDRKGICEYEGVRVDSRVIELTSNGPILKLNLCSPVFMQLRHTNIRFFHDVRAARYWNGAHPLTESFHGVRGRWEEEPPQWIKNAVESFKKVSS